MSGTNQLVKVTLRNPLDKSDTIDYTIKVNDTPMAQLWYMALQDIIIQNKYLEKNFCFLGFPNSTRNLAYICQELNWAKDTINGFFDDYEIKEIFQPDTLRNDINPNQKLLNQLHLHFEHLQGTVWELSDYYCRADYATKFAIRQLNNLCHEAESLILSQRKQATYPDWVRPSQITTFLNAERKEFPNEYKTTFEKTRYDRKFGEVYLHWTQIGKTLYEVFRDEQGVDIDRATCDAINHLRYYSGEFDIEWGQSVTYSSKCPWHAKEMEEFYDWLERNKFEVLDTQYNFGYHPVGQVELKESFGTDDFKSVWPILSKYLDIYSITAGNVTAVYDYTWSDSDYYEQQINQMKPGYDFSSRG